jgi:nicotinamide-nucleotide amidase
MIAEILAIGDELTSGQSLDTNSQWLSLRLEELGVRVLYHSTIGDELTPGVEAFRTAIGRADIVIATGGLGPTADDLTRDALAQAVGRPLQLDADSLETIRRMFARRNRPMAPTNERQAMFPAGSRVVRNPHGTAPGIDLDVPREGRSACRVICLPGVPAEMIEMWRDSVGAVLDGFIAAALGDARRVIRRRQLHCFGAGESQIEAMLPDLIRRGRRPTVGITAGGATISLRIVADGATEQECFVAIEPVAATIRKCLGSLVFGEGDERLQDVVVRMLRERGKTLATAECSTAGLLAEQLGGIADGQDVFRGGWTLSELSLPLAQTAAACRKRFAADFGLAVGPLQATIGIAIASDEGVRVMESAGTYHPAFARLFLVKQALNQFRLAMLA